MDDTLHILIADYVPIANKGEEAIVRGIEDMLSEGRPVALGLFDDVPQVTQRGNITVFPRQWVFRFEGNSTLSGRGRILMQMWIAMQLRCGIYGPLKNLTPSGRPVWKDAPRGEGVPPSNRGQNARDSGMGAGSPLGAERPSGAGQDSALGPPKAGFQPMNHRQDADATKNRGQDARDTKTLAGAAQCRPLQDFFERANCVLVGHDGVFCVESCGIIHLAKRYGKRAGILGASTGIAGGRFYKAGLYRRTLEESDFCVFREEHSRASMKQVCCDLGKLMVAPDPAFAMRPEPPEAAREVLERQDRYREARQAGRPIVAVTALEKGRVYAGFRPDLQGQAKQQAHARYLATILDTLVARHGAFMLFLPHSVEETGSDIVAARHVVEQMKAAPSDYAILEHDCEARLLKSIVRECDFLVGERTHSLIGSVSVGTPFAAMTNRQDTRTHGILGQMCRCEPQIIDMDIVNERDASQKVCELFERRDAIRKSLERIGGELSTRIDEVARIIKGPCGSIQGSHSGRSTCSA